ncbi:MAG: hypothetical protein J0H55_07105 [Chitinophagaceae bacterium]|nr:hypothetical protein [Chitinophagaceae bacterium]
MFDEILNAVKSELGSHPAMQGQTPEQQNAIHNEIATHLSNVLDSGNLASMAGGLLDKLKGAATSGSIASGAIEGGLVSSLASKFNLPPSITGAISGALPGIIQKYLNQKK